MRVIGDIAHPRYRITLFTWNEKYMAKIEAGALEQTYKFNRDDFGSIEMLKAYFDTAFFADIDRIFETMQEAAIRAGQRFSTRPGKA